LVVFKYYNFIAENVNLVATSLHSHSQIPLLSILLPIGLSFHTFQAMSYTIEVYRGNQQPERHFGIYALYVMFYPQLVAGPIERPQNIIHQFHERKQFNYENARSGLLLMAWGLFKKVVIADRLGLFVNQVYGNLEDYTGIPLIIATVAFAFQIFCDFSGYSDIAIGSARFMGYHLMSNFDRPYMANQFSEFWRRWHISLSTWFRDYVYIPLGGNLVSKTIRYRNLFIVFLLSGIWHGANWTFVVWGVLHGFYLILEQEVNAQFPSWKTPQRTSVLILKRFILFAFVCFAWIFFRAPEMKDALYVVANLFTNIPDQLNKIITNEHLLRFNLLYLSQSFSEFLIATIAVLILIIVHYAQRKQTFDEWVLSKKPILRWTFYYLLIGAFVIFGVFNKSGFIYFQF
jgi:alginate O-acetyltransferase complex protein AlgI